MICINVRYILSQWNFQFKYDLLLFLLLVSVFCVNVPIIIINKYNILIHCNITKYFIIIIFIFSNSYIIRMYLNVTIFPPSHITNVKLC